MNRPLASRPFVEVAKGVTLDTFETTLPAITTLYTVQRLSEMYPLPPMLRVYAFPEELSKSVGPEVTIMGLWDHVVRDVLVTRPMLADTYTFHLQEFDWDRGDYGRKSDATSPTGVLLSRAYCLPYSIARDGSVKVYEHGEKPPQGTIVSGYVMVDRRELRKHHDAERCTARMLVDVAAYAGRWLQDMVLCSKDELYTVTNYRRGAPHVVSCVLVRGSVELEDFTRFLKK